MSDQPAPSAPASGAKHWHHAIVTSRDDDGYDEVSFAQLLDDSCAMGYEIVSYSVVLDDQGPFHSVLLRRQASPEESNEIHNRRVARFEESIRNR